MANADATAGQLRRLVLEILVTSSPVSARRRSQTSDSIIAQNGAPAGQGTRCVRTVTSAPTGDTAGRGGIGVSISAANLAPGMQHHRDKSADGNDQNHSRDRYANIGKVFRWFWRLKKRHLAVLAGRCTKVHNLSASGTYSLHTPFPPSRAVFRLIYHNDGVPPIVWP